MRQRVILRLGILILIIIILALGGYILYLRLTRDTTPDTGDVVKEEYGIFPDTSGAGTSKDTKTGASATTTQPLSDALKKGWTRYRNTQYAFQFDYPSSLTFPKDITGACLSTSSPATQSPFTVRAKSAQSYVFMEIPNTTSAVSGYINAKLPEGCSFEGASLVSLNVTNKPENFTNLRAHVEMLRDQIILASKDSAAGITVSIQPFTGGKIGGYQLIVRGLSAVGNTTVSTYFEREGMMYVMTYAYAAAYTGGTNPNPYAEDPNAVLILQAARDVVASFKTIEN